jgi:hypothetical protein
MMTLLALWHQAVDPETATPSSVASPDGASLLSWLLNWNIFEIGAALLGLAVFLVLASQARRKAPRHEFWIAAALLPCWSFTYVLTAGILHLGREGFLRGALATLVAAAVWAARRGDGQTGGNVRLPFSPWALLTVPLSSFVLLPLGFQVFNYSVPWPLMLAVLQLAAIAVAFAVSGARAPEPAIEAEPRRPELSIPDDPPPPPPPPRERETPQPSRGARLFISYRREDSAYISDRINERLTQRFGRQTVFKDVDSIPLGQDFRKHLREAVGGCDVLLAVIGKEWLAVDRQTGARRIDDPRDHLRIEVESALERDIPVIPVLVQGAAVPTEAELPETLRALAYRNAQPVRPDPDFNNDMDRLLRGIEQLLR